MMQFALIFIVVALIAGAIGFSGWAAAYSDIAKILSALFLLIGVVSAYVHKLNDRR